MRVSNWLNKYTSQIKLLVPNEMLSEIITFNIPHPSNIEQGKTHSKVSWHIKGHLERSKSLKWHNDIVTKLSLCLDATSLVNDVNKELIPKEKRSERVYELKDFNSVEDLRYWKSKKIYVPSTFKISGDYQSSVIRSVAYSLARQNILTKDLLKQESLSALNNNIEKRWFKYQINRVFEWCETNYTGRAARQSEGTRRERALKNSSKMKESNYAKIEKLALISVAMGLKPSYKAIVKLTGLSINTVKKHLKTLLDIKCQSIGTIRGKRDMPIYSLLLETLNKQLLNIKESATYNILYFKRRQSNELYKYKSRCFSI